MEVIISIQICGYNEFNKDNVQVLKHCEICKHAFVQHLIVSGLIRNNNCMLIIYIKVPDLIEWHNAIVIEENSLQVTLFDLIILMN